jgi:hypothetical protein
MIFFTVAVLLASLRRQQVQLGSLILPYATRLAKVVKLIECGRIIKPLARLLVPVFKS